jgi:hypothetical protein
MEMIRIRILRLIKGRKLPALKQSTIERKKREGYSDKPLERTKELLDSIEVEIDSEGNINIWILDRYKYIWHLFNLFPKPIILKIISEAYEEWQKTI